ncbi:MAG: hypothetical protein M3327_00270, partial [Actinomycetota bacterium]|nr:hypothetical protein [Actinomycetota bacterium]
MTEELLRLLLQRAAPARELDAEHRAWEVVRRAYAEREAVPRRRSPGRPLVALAAALVVVAAALTPPGRAVTSWVRDAIGPDRVAGRKNARSALASLPSRGRLLVVARGGVWVAGQDGSKRRLGAYDDASWSPRGLYVV